MGFSSIAHPYTIKIILGWLEPFLREFLQHRGDFKDIFKYRDMKERAEKEIKDLKARFHRPGGAQQRKYRMLKFVNLPKQQLITLDNGKKQSIFDWFKSELNYTIKYPTLPLIHCGDPKKTIYLPIECLELERQVLNKKYIHYFCNYYTATSILRVHFLKYITGSPI